MATESILSATFGAPGAGKSYCRVRWLVDDFLINNPTGLYITNIPLMVDVIADYVSRRLASRENPPSAEDIKKRLVVIPDAIMIAWEKLNNYNFKDLALFDNKTFPPVQYLQQYDLSGAHIAIDEFHKIFGKKSPKPLRALWNDWFAEIRKTGCTFEAITQSYGQMNEEYLDKCATRIELVNHSDSRDIFFHIKQGDWYELRAGMTGKTVVQRVTCRETMRGTNDRGAISWIPTGKSETFLITPDYFRFYDSFRNSTGSSGVRKSPSEIYGRGVWKWFLRRHIWALFSRFLIVIIFCWLTFGGGILYVMKGFLGTMQTMAVSNGAVKKTVDKKPSVQSAVASPGVQAVPVQIGPDGKPLPAVQIGPDGKSLPPMPVEDLNQYKPAMFFEEFVFLRNCVRVFVGYEFKGGKYDGQKVDEIDAKERFYRLSGGDIVSMY